ncbi:EF-P lysine aminoacylase GenX [Patescibacteria group bacterium]|uniref:EF-P lysine aminoacylase GenX n=1 Tax=candidate division WWE3 bacterium TaxID=2053526 RepID=A0A928TTU4_UNCKA|nr:EF-P lysine aminoacylase GenX [Anaerolineales bacterium]MBE7525196.1 EF-P lysine aminoacylase GenX [candidate division WWE3 bacterium]MCL4732829.1 EF-P lysine aminoacylase GenX [Patescibacteria group bacterium]MDL1953010.1 EF-P lysine aminoacylase GenX [Candidatus Uhrbacteria bacterium UHB]RIL00203.1 MAG: EF-P lysine aminoacylase GenX [Candidatus Uhrbacteria bacterium]
MNIEWLKQKAAAVKAIRQFFDERGYTEMHTPRLVGLPGQEPHLEPFWTEVIEQGGAPHPAALVTSPEYSMKKLLAAGMDRIYDLGPCFRNEEPFDGSHDPEFLMLEWYRKNADLDSLMDETEEMVKAVRREPWAVGQSSLIPDGPFRRVTCEEAWRMYAGTELAPLLEDREAMARVALEHGQTVSESDSWDDIYFKIFLSAIEPKLGSEPTFLYRYPASQAALARRTTNDQRFADRVELYIGGLELANGFAELTDANEQRKRFLEEQEMRRKLGKDVWPVDEALLRALPDMGNTVGTAFGVDRFAMLLTGAASINEVIPFSARERFSR